MDEQRWLALMDALGVEHSIKYFDALMTAYTEPHRFYHTTRHIDAMLQHFDCVSDQAEDPAQLELAIWFHDAVYKPLSKNNELASANWARQLLDQAGVDSSNVYNLIMATVHNGPVAGGDASLMVDIDLTILGAEPAVYDEFERSVRKEYKMVPYFIYRRKRKEILQSFLDKDSIFCVEYFKGRYENLARANLARAMQAL